MDEVRTPGYDSVLFVSLDTLRSDCLAANPVELWRGKYPSLRAPDTRVLDALVAEGMFFPNTISAAPYTAASHGTVFTGRFPRNDGLFEFYGGRLQRPTVFSRAKAAGYRTLASVDFPVILGPELGFSDDLDVRLVEDETGLVDHLVAGGPAVAFAHFGGIHAPYGFHNLRIGGDAYLRTLERMESWIPADVPMPTDQINETHRDAEDEAVFLRYKRVTNHLYGEGRYEELFGLYLDGIGHFLRTRFADFITNVRARMDAAGRSLLIVLFGDHGHELDASSYGHHNSMSEGVLRVPLAFIGDGIEPGVHLGRVRTADITPTVADLIGLPDPVSRACDGRTLAGILRGQETPGDLPAIAQSYGADTRQFVTYQKRQRRQEDPGPLDHVLLGEACYLGEHRYVHMAHRYSAAFRIEPVDERWVESLGDLVPRVADGVDDTPFRAVLADYNGAGGAGAVTPAGDALRGQLRSLGYDI